LHAPSWSYVRCTSRAKKGAKVRLTDPPAERLRLPSTVWRIGGATAMIGRSHCGDGVPMAASAESSRRHQASADGLFSQDSPVSPLGQCQPMFDRPLRYTSRHSRDQGAGTPLTSEAAGHGLPHGPEGAPAHWRRSRARERPCTEVLSHAGTPMGAGQRDKWRGNGGDASTRRMEKIDLGVFRERVIGLEPTTFCLGSRHSAN
jgi:hypothetical protein